MRSSSQQRLPHVANVPLPRRRTRDGEYHALYVGQEVYAVGHKPVIDRACVRLQAKGFKAYTMWHPGALIR